MRHELRAMISAELGAELRGAAALKGGSINSAWAVDLDDGRRVFVKANDGAPADMFAAEVRGLAFLREGLKGVEGLGVPEVVAVSPHFLVLELIEEGPPCADFDELLGRGLAALHRSGRQGRQGGQGDLGGRARALGGADPQKQARAFGLDHDNYIGSEHQRNGMGEDWPSFYADQRLRPLLARADARGLISPSLQRRFEQLYAVLDERCGPPEPRARLHGDLWGGNLHRDRRGRPVLIDPAVYFGHREVDLAMMRLFGGFSPRTFAAYGSAWPLASGWERRVDLYQLYPLLVHVVLFGRAYLGGLESALGRLV